MTQRFTGAVQAAQRGARVALFNRNLAGARQMPPHERIAEQFALGHDAELRRQTRVEHRNVKRRKMVRGVYRGLRRVDMLGAFTCDMDPAWPGSSAPNAREPVLHAPSRSKNDDSRDSVPMTPCTGK